MTLTPDDQTLVYNDRGRPGNTHGVCGIRTGPQAERKPFPGQYPAGQFSRLHTTKVLRLSEDLPMVIEIIDTQERINSILPILDEHVKEGLITMETVRVIRYHHDEKQNS